MTSFSNPFDTVSRRTARCCPEPGSLAGLLLVLTGAAAHAGQSIQPGFYSHEPDGVSLSISGARSGELCRDTDGNLDVCTAVMRIVVQGDEVCDGGDGNQYPCTRYGYRFDYAGATPGQTIQCSARRQDAFRTQNMTYTLNLDAAEGTIFYPTWSGAMSVDRETLISEVHECSYDGAPLGTIEFLLAYEPAASAPQAPTTASNGQTGEPLMLEIPDACAYLTEPVARNTLRADRVQASSANERIPTFYSQCTYSGVGVVGRSVSFFFKFMLYDLYDVEKLDEAQLTFNITFTGGGEPPVEQLQNLGKLSYAFDDRDRTRLLVVAGIEGPPDGAGRPTELTAIYELADSDAPYAERLAKLRAFAERHLAEWLSESNQ